MKGKVREIRESVEEERRGKDARMHMMPWLDLQKAHLNIDLFAQGLQLRRTTGLAWVGDLQG